MIVSEKNIDNFDLQFPSDQKCIEFDSSLNGEQLITGVEKVIRFETDNPEANIKLKIKNNSTDSLISLFKYVFANTSSIRNISLINNVYLLVKTYNTFSNDFFSSDEVFINNIEQFLDIKLDLQNEIEKMIHNIVETFLSICKSSNKFEYTILDQYEDIPQFYNILIGGMDIISMFGLMSTIDGKVEFNFKNYKNAFFVADSILGKYAIADKMMNNFLSRINNDRERN